MNEKETTEAEQKKHGDVNASIERMMANLEKIESIIRTARFVVKGADDCAYKWATLSKAIGDIRHVLGPCTFMPDACFHKVYTSASGTGAFHTPKEIIDFVTANPPLGEVKDAPTPLDPSAPEMVRGGGAAEGGFGITHEPSGGGENPVPHGHFAQGRCKRRHRLADGRALALETAFLRSAQFGASQGAGRQRREGGTCAMRTHGEIERDAQMVAFIRRCAVALEAIAVALNEIARNEFLEQIQPVDEEAHGNE